MRPVGADEDGVAPMGTIDEERPPRVVSTANSRNASFHAPSRRVASSPSRRKVPTAVVPSSGS